MKIRKIIFTFFIYLICSSKLYSIEADVFVQSTINRASEVLSEDISKEIKIKELKKIAKDTVDIKRIGFYTLGPIRKNLTDDQKIRYSELFEEYFFDSKAKMKAYQNLTDDQKSRYSQLFEEYFLTSFSNRLVVYSNPDIDVYDKKILSEKFVIVNSLLKGTKERPEVKIDWRIYTKNPEKPLILDLIIEGLSLARTQKEEFASILNSNDGNINALFETLESFSNSN